MRAFTYTPKPKNRKHEQIGFYIFRIWWPNSSNYDRLTEHDFNYINTYTTTYVGYNLVTMEVIDGLSSVTIVLLFYKYKTINYRLLLDKAQSDYKGHDLKAVTWNNIRKPVELQVWVKLCMHFLIFRPRIRFICERSAEN